jgi:hypothetical protein
MFEGFGSPKSHCLLTVAQARFQNANFGLWARKSAETGVLPLDKEYLSGYHTT